MEKFKKVERKNLQRKQNRTRARVNTLETFNKTMNTTINTMNFSAKGECLFRFYQFFSLRNVRTKLFDLFSSIDSFAFLFEINSIHVYLCFYLIIYCVEMKFFFVYAPDH